jgi:hypothetical protein
MGKRGRLDLPIIQVSKPKGIMNNMEEILSLFIHDSRVS